MGFVELASNLDRKHLSLLMKIPGVGEKTAQDLWRMGIKEPADLQGRDPEELYETLCERQRDDVDRCMLYVFRCAVYYVSNESHDPELLKWWNWKDV
jgi:uroporphyrinogen-III synthase